MISEKLKFIKPFIFPSIFFIIFNSLYHLIPHVRIILNINYTKRIEDTMSYLLLILIWYTGAYIINKSIEHFFFNLFLEKKLNTSVPLLIKKLIKLSIFFVTTLAILNFVFEKSITGIITATGALGLVLGFALKNMISDIFDGVSLSIDKPFNIGDFIHFNDSSLKLQATVIETTWRTTRFRCDTAGVLVVPNSQLYKMPFTNLTTSGQTFFDLFFKFDIDAPIDKTKKLLLSAAISTAGVMQTPKPQVVIKNIDKGNILYRLLFAYKTSEHAQRIIKDAVAENVIKLIGYSGYSFSLDKEQYVIRKTKPSEDKILITSQEEFLHKVPLFASLTKDEYQLLLNDMDSLTIKVNTKIVEIDDQLSSLFIVKEGLLSVHIQSNNKLVKVAYLNTGAFFGEMSLLTGSKASATIISENGAKLYKINKPIIKSLFKNNPELVRAISLTIAKRQAENNKRKAEILSKDQLNAETQSIADKLVSSIYNFFKL